MAQIISTHVGGLKGAMANGIPTGLDYDQVDLNSAEGRKEFADAVSGYFKDVREPNGMYATGQKNTRTGHLDALPVRDEVDVRFYGPRDDASIFDLFQYVDKSSSKNPTYKFANVNAASIIFEEKTVGKEARVRKVSAGAPQDLKSVTHEGALGIDDDTQRFDDYGVFEQNIQRVPGVWMDQYASNLALLFTSLGAGVNETFSVDLITTINNACNQILEDVGDLYGLSDSENFGLMYNGRDAAKVRQALVSNLTLANDNNSAKQLEFNIVPVKTRKIAAGGMYLTLPGRDIVDVEWDGLWSEYARNAHAGADDYIFRSRRNAGIGNVQQVRRLSGY
ncbi:MAG: hypothetical protein HUJ30_02390 [Gammaproteobacteria bacterium]|nr:hypothetical protein [Gammaproteobacteria bacterium]